MIPSVAFLAVEPASGERGGAEAFHDGFCDALARAGWQVSKIRLAVDESTFEGVLRAYLAAYDLDLSQYDMVISSKAPSYAVRHPRHICYLQHTIRVFYDMYDREYPRPWADLERQRERIIGLDNGLLDTRRVAKIFTNGDETTRRLRKFNSLESEVLYPGLLRDHFRQGRFDNYLFIPGRLHRWKRIDLLVEAMRHVKSDVELRIAGTGQDQEALEALAAASGANVRFMGRLDDEECVEQYANALAVPFVPIMEDFGYITLEAFRSGKPVITCTDSGTPVDLVARAEAGMVCDPTPEAIAKAIDAVASSPDACQAMGARGLQSTSTITWERAASRVMEVSKDMFGF